MYKLYAVHTPDSDKPNFCNLNEIADGRLLAGGTPDSPHAYLMNSRTGILSREEINKRLQAGDIDGFPAECYIRAGNNPGGVFVELKSDYDAKRDAAEALKITMPEVYSRRVGGNFIVEERRLRDFSLLVGIDSRADVDRVTIHGVTFDLGSTAESIKDGLGRKINLKRVTNWEITENNIENLTWWTNRRRSLELQGICDFERKYEANDYTPHIKGQEEVLDGIVSAMTSPAAEMVLRINAELQRLEERNEPSEAVTEHSQKAIAAYEAGERDPGKIESIWQAYRQDERWIATLRYI